MKTLLVIEKVVGIALAVVSLVIFVAYGIWAWGIWHKKYTTVDKEQDNEEA